MFGRAYKRTFINLRVGKAWLPVMINFEEELKKFHPSMEVEDVEDAIYNQDLTDMADVLVKMVKTAKEDEE